MPLAVGQSLSFYEILGPLGAGGMGEVYLARDRRLEREVAIKVLPEHFADDEERLRRFEREAKTLASLNHPNVAGIHGIDQVQDTCFLAMELVPGEDLEERLKRGALPIEEAIDVCRQIAEGLEAAHEAGVVHRDLKPANVRVTPEGVAKILDFGLAKPIRPEVTKSGTTSAQSDSFLMTEEGLVLGTPTYMSPEQARGKPVDRRTDIWAFGCVLYECLTGERAFGGESITDILASIVGAEPDWSSVPPLHGRVRELLRRTLSKDPRARLRDMGEARIVLEQAAREPFEQGAAVTPSPAGSRVFNSASRGAIWITIALALGFVVGWSTGAKLGTAPPSRAESGIYAQVHTFPEGTRSLYFSISPDGRSFAWANKEGIWVRKLDELEPLLVHGQEVDGLSWSPDSTQLAFLQDEATWRIAVRDGYPNRIPGGEVSEMTAMRWLADERILFGDGEFVWTLPADGGSREVLLELEGEGPGAHWHLLHPLPDGGMLGALHSYGDEFRSIDVYRDGGSEVVFEVAEGELSGMVVTSGGSLLYGVRIEGEGSLWSVPLSLEELRPLGEPRLVAKHADQPSVSRGGALAYLQNVGDSGKGQMAWFGLGEPELTFLDEPYSYLREARLSPDGDRIVFGTGPYSRPTFRVLDLGRGVSTPVVQHRGLAFMPIWLDEGHVVLSSITDPGGAFVYPLSGRGVPEQLSEDVLFGLSPDGQYAVYTTIEASFDDAVVRIVGPDGTALPDLGPKDRFLSFSPDGRWMLYGSERSGTWQVYLSRFPRLDEEDWSVCVGEADGAWFREDLSAIYYTIGDRAAAGGALHGVELSLEPEVKLGAPEFLRQLDQGTEVQDFDGADRFLIISGALSTGETRAFVRY